MIFQIGFVLYPTIGQFLFVYHKRWLWLWFFSLWFSFFFWAIVENIHDAGAFFACIIFCFFIIGFLIWSKSLFNFESCVSFVLWWEISRWFGFSFGWFLFSSGCFLFDWSGSFLFNWGGVFVTSKTDKTLVVVMFVMMMTFLNLDTVNSRCESEKCNYC